MRNLRTAVDDIHSARDAAAIAGRASRRARAGIAAVDALLAVIEEGHLAGANKGSGMRDEWNALLEEAGLSVPREIAGARTTVELHARLLEWQEELLGQCDPRRSELLATLDGPDLDLGVAPEGDLQHVEHRSRRHQSAPLQPEPLWAYTPSFGRHRNR